MPGETILMWLAITSFILIGASLAIWLFAHQATRPRLAVAPTIEVHRDQRHLQLRLENLHPAPSEVRAAYLMFASGTGLALRPALPGSAPLPLLLPRMEHAYLRYDLEVACQQLSHHPEERSRSVACLLAPDDMVRHLLPETLARALEEATAAIAPSHLASCEGCSEVTEWRR
jgi:hypothetical protein